MFLVVFHLVFSYDIITALNIGSCVHCAGL